MYTVLKKIFTYSVLSATALMLSAAAYFSTSGNQQKKSSTLKIGMETTYPPYEFVDENGVVVGFDVDLGKALAEKIGLDAQVVPMGFDALILALKQGKIDVILSGMSITHERQKEITMLPYHGTCQKELKLLFWESIPAGVFSLGDLSYFSKPVAVQAGTFQAEFLENTPFVEAKNLMSTNDLLVDLKYGKSLAAVVETHVAHVYLAKFPELKALTIPLEEKDWVLGEGIGIKKENIQLAKKLHEALEELKSEGSIQKLENKWFAK